LSSQTTCDKEKCTALGYCIHKLLPRMIWLSR